MKSHALGTWVLVLILASPVTSFSQTGTGSIQGTIKDNSGGVVPGAAVTITHTQTTRQFATTSTEVGFFLFPSVQMGPYEITVELPGMEAWKAELTLQVGQTAEVNPVLKIRATATEITVAGDVTPLVTTTGPTIANVVERARIDQLPVNGRRIQDLLYLTTPGLESGSVPRVFGLRYAVELLQDGAVLMNRQWQQIPARPPGLDTIEEFRAETNNSSAKMNRPGTVILTTRAGTNDFHGSIFETARNSAIGVARARQDYYVKPPHFVRNEFGGSLGGPVRLPRIYDGTRKTFFFFAYEGMRQRSASTRAVSMPTAAMREGDFSGLIDSQGRLITLYDPLTTDSNWRRQPFPNNRIPLSRRSPLATHLYKITPLPTHPEVNPLVGSNWFGLGFNNWDQDTLTARVDHRLTDRDQLFFRYSHNPAFQRFTTALGTAPTTLDGKANGALDDNTNDSGVVSWTHTFSPTFFSETIGSVQHDSKGRLPIAPNEDIATQLGLPNPFGGLGFPRISSTGFGMDYDSSANLNIDFSRIYNIDQNFTKVRGRHEFQFGMRWRYESLDILPDQQVTHGQVFFNTLATSQYDPASGSSYGPVPLTGHEAANMFLGHSRHLARFYRSYFRMITGETSGYFQDNWKVNSRLTLNFGLRYEYNHPAKERDRSLVGFNPKTKAIVLGRTTDDLIKLKHAHPTIVKAYEDLGVKYETPAQAGLPDHLVYANKWDFGPRAGFAWRVWSTNRPLVLRGGYGLYAFTESLRLYTGNLRDIPPTNAIFDVNPNSASQSPDGLPNYLLRSSPTLIAGLNSKDALDLNKAPGISRGSAIVYYLDPHQPTARAHEWNMTLEKEILADTSVRLSYVGTQGIRLAQYYSYNDAPNDYVWYTRTGEPLPTGPFAAVARRNFDKEIFGTIQQYQKTGWSNNNSIVVEVQRRFAQGYGFQLFYTLSNAIRAAGDGWRDDILQATNMFLPGDVPEDPEKRNRLMFYRRDIDIPKHRVNWNWIADLPFGRGKLVGGNAGGLLNALIGGWQIAGTGSLISRYFQVPTSMWGPAGKLEVYGKKYPIQDCRSGVCYDGWLYFNGYIPPNRINSIDSNGKPNGVMGVPEWYKPFQTPLIPWGSTTLPANAPANTNLQQFWDTNTVWIPLKNDTVQRTTYNPNLHFLQNEFVAGPMRWSMNVSAFKEVRLTETVALRFNIDFFNVFNRPGTAMPSSTGIITNQFSDLGARVLQLTGRLTW